MSTDPTPVQHRTYAHWHVCPTCNAGIGDLCLFVGDNTVGYSNFHVKRKGTPTPQAHAERYVVAKKAQQAAEEAAHA